MDYTDIQLMEPFETKKYVLDIRMKMMLLVMVSVFVLGGMGNSVPHLQHFTCITLFVLLLLAGKVIPVLIFGTIYLATVILTECVFPGAAGGLQLFLVAMTIIFIKFMPMFFAGAYIITTTSVSEFSAGLKKWNVPDKITVPFCVMFRMFPTIKSEFDSINVAMRMREIEFDITHVGKFIEYRIVPLIICVVKIGDELSQSALTRGLGGVINRTCVCQVRFKLLDYVMLGLFIIVIVLSILFSL